MDMTHNLATDELKDEVLASIWLRFYGHLVEAGQSAEKNPVDRPLDCLTDLQRADW